MATKETMINAASKLVDASQREHTFTKTVRINGEDKTGEFTVKMPTVVDRIRIGMDRATALRGITPDKLDRLTDDLIYMSVFLPVVLTKVPSWWNIQELEDIDALYDIYEEVINWVNSFRRNNGKGGNEGTSDGTSNEKNVDSGEVIQSPIISSNDTKSN